MLFRIVKYRMDDGFISPEEPLFLEAETLQEAQTLAKRVLGVENVRDMVLSKEQSRPKAGARILNNKMNFEELYGLEPGTTPAL